MYVLPCNAIFILYYVVLSVFIVIFMYFYELSNHVKSNAKTSYYQSEMWYYCTKFDGR